MWDVDRKKQCMSPKRESIHDDQELLGPISSLIPGWMLLLALQLFSYDVYVVVVGAIGEPAECHRHR